jgi:hypothetical protein
MTTWDELAAALADVLPGLPEEGVLQLHEAADPEEGRYAQLWRRAAALHAEVAALPGQATPPAQTGVGQPMATAGWLPPDEEHLNWWLGLDLPAAPEAYRELAVRLVAALRDGFGLGSPADVAYRAWSGEGPLPRPELGLPDVRVEYFTRLATGDTQERPTELVRRVWLGPRCVDEALGGDGRWRPSRTLEHFDLGRLRDEVVPVGTAAALKIVEEWRQAAGEPSFPPTVPQAPRLAEAIGARLDAGGQPVAPPTRLPAGERRAVAEYLRSAPVVVAAFGVATDPFDPERPEVVPLDVHTDGEWVWSESLAYYALRYGYPPQRELLEHIRHRGYRVPDVGEEALDRAARLVTG